MADEQVVVDVLLNVLNADSLKQLEKAFADVESAANTFENTMSAISKGRSMARQKIALEEYGLSIKKVFSSDANNKIKEHFVLFDLATGEQIAYDKATKKVMAIELKKNKAFQKSNTLMSVGTKWASKFRMGYLGIMFAGQALAQAMNAQLDPARELLGIREMEAMFMAEKNLPIAEQELDNLEKQWDAWDQLTESQQVAQAQSTATWAKIGEGMQTGGQAVLGVWAAMNVGKDLFGKDGLFHQLKNVDWKGTWETAKTAFAGFETYIKDSKIGKWMKDSIVDNLDASSLGKWFSGQPGWAQAGIAIGAAIGAGIAGFMLGNWLITQLIEPFNKAFSGAGETAARIFIGALGAILVAAGIALAVAAGWTGLGAVAAAALGAAGIGLIAAAATYQAPKLAAGGIVTGPTHAIVGEAGPEAIIPLDRLTGMGGGGPINMNVYTTSSLTPDQISSLSRELADRFGDELKRLNTGRMSY